MNKIKDINFKVPYLSIDIETTGLNPWDCKIILLQIATEEAVYIIDARKLTKADIKKLNKPLADRSILKIFHSASFDATFMKHHWGSDINNIYDTMLAERVLLGDTNIKSSLKDTVDRRLGITLAKGYATSFIYQADPSIEFIEGQLKYGEEDVIHLNPVRLVQIDKAGKLGLIGIINLENRLVEVIVDMRERGIQFNIAAWLDIAHENEAKMEQHLEALNNITDNQVDNWNSPIQIKKYLAEEHKIYISSVDELQDYSDNMTVAAIMQMRQYHKAVTTYGKDWLITKLTNRAPIQYKNTVDAFGRVHCDYQQVLETGRLSCSKPNLQQIPNYVAGEPSGHHECFIATAGYRLIISDFKAQELAIIAVGANDKTWIDIILEGGDLHSYMGQKIFESDWNEKEHRPLAKTLNFGLAYGLSAKGFAAKTGLTEVDAKYIVKKYFEAVPNIKKWLDENASNAVTYNVSKSFLGRRRSLVGCSEEWHKRNIGKNNPVQSTGADITKLAMVMLDQQIQSTGINGHILHSVHDEIISESQDWEKFGELQQECMEDAANKILGMRIIKAPTEISLVWKK